MFAELKIDERARFGAESSEILIQEQKSGWVKENRPAAPLTPTELDRVYELPFVRQTHPQAAKVPAFSMIRDSLTIVRGCSGNCSFCALTRHQGARVVSRTQKSIVREAETVAGQAAFSGTISDLGGPTANLYATTCANLKSCKRFDCLYPSPCVHLKVNEKSFISLLDEVGKINGVKKVLISSGLRLNLLQRTPKLLARLIARHLPGVMKIAPEHSDPEILRLMHKNDALELELFLKQCRRLAKEAKLKVDFSPYLISSHPGCTLKEMRQLAQTIKKNGLKARQYQDFTPTPGTLSTAMYVTGLDRDTLTPIHVPKGIAERRRQRQELEKISGRHQAETRQSHARSGLLMGKTRKSKQRRVCE